MSGGALAFSIVLLVLVLVLAGLAAALLVAVRRQRDMLHGMQITLDDVAGSAARAERSAADAASAVAVLLAARRDRSLGLPALMSGDADAPEPTLSERVARSTPAIKAAGVAAGATRAVKHLRGSS